MLFNIKARLIVLGKRVIDLIPELEKRGITKVTPGELSNALNGRNTADKAQSIVTASNGIVTEWEKESGLASDKSINS